ncbi:unnamed protein product [Brassica oleracea var. botrytis]
MSNYTIVMTKILETCKGFQGFFRLMLVHGGGIEVTFRIEHIGGDMSLNIPKADDIFMKVSKERTEKEYGTLARGSGFQGFQVVCRAYGTHIMEFLKKI